MGALNILLIEDDAGDANLVRYKLKYSDQASRVDWIQSLAEIDRVRPHPDVILLDLNLPDSNGLATVKRCKRLLPDTPIIVLTGHDDMDFSLKTLEAGSQDYLVKTGLEEDALIRSIRYAIERHQLEHRLHRSEELMRAAIEGGNLSVWEWDLRRNEGRRQNETHIQLGFALESDGLRETGDSDTLIQRIHVDDRPAFFSALERYLRHETPRFQCEFRYRQSGDSWPWFFISGHAVHWQQDQPVRMVGIQQNISERKALEAQLKDLAMHDPLTGLLNRRSLIHEMNREYGRVLRCDNYAAGLLMLDIDFFKRVNDTHGHATGDEVLKAFATGIRQQLRENDVFGRLGGEEFAILLPDTPTDGTRIVAEKVRQAVESLVIHHDGQQIRITTSVGTAQLDASDSRPDGALIQADKALYAAKRAGRNRVMDASGTAPGTQPALA